MNTYVSAFKSCSPPYQTMRYIYPSTFSTAVTSGLIPPVRWAMHTNRGMLVVASHLSAEVRGDKKGCVLTRAVYHPFSARNAWRALLACRFRRTLLHREGSRGLTAYAF